MPKTLIFSIYGMGVIGVLEPGVRIPLSPPVLARSFAESEDCRAEASKRGPRVRSKSSELRLGRPGSVFAGDLPHRSFKQSLLPTSQLPERVILNICQGG